MDSTAEDGTAEDGTAELFKKGGRYGGITCHSQYYGRYGGTRHRTCYCLVNIESLSAYLFVYKS